MTTPTANDFPALFALQGAAKLRQSYLGTLDLGFTWDRLLKAHLLAGRRRNMVEALFLTIGLSDGQIALLLETTGKKIYTYRMNHGIRKLRSPKVRAVKDDPDIINFCRHWKFIFGRDYDSNSANRPFFSIELENRLAIARDADRLSEYHKA